MIIQLLEKALETGDMSHVSRAIDLLVGTKPKPTSEKVENAGVTLVTTGKKVKTAKTPKVVGEKKTATKKGRPKRAPSIQTECTKCQEPFTPATPTGVICDRCLGEYSE